MNHKKIDQLFRNYIDQFAFLINSQNNETYKWQAVNCVQQHWNLVTDDISDMLKQSFADSYNLINNRIVQPVSGLIALAKKEPVAIRQAFEVLLQNDNGNIDLRQQHVDAFVDECNMLLEKHFKGKWKYSQDVRTAIAYLSMIKPDDNYMFKSAPAHVFAKYMDYINDIGAGQTFKLKYYYAMCDELVSHILTNENLLEVDASRKAQWNDPQHHMLAYDLIYCMATYQLTTGLPDPKPKDKTSQQKIEREQQNSLLQDELLQLQDQIDDLNNQIVELPCVDFTGQNLHTKAFGVVTIFEQQDKYLKFTFDGQTKQFTLPDCIANGFAIPERSDLITRYKQEQQLLKQMIALENQQRIKTLELLRYQ